MHCLYETGSTKRNSREHYGGVLLHMSVIKLYRCLIEWTMIHSNSALFLKNANLHSFEGSKFRKNKQKQCSRRLSEYIGPCSYERHE